jgi:hypothetical protein
VVVVVVLVAELGLKALRETSDWAAVMMAPSPAWLVAGLCWSLVVEAETTRTVHTAHMSAGDIWRPKTVGCSRTIPDSCPPLAPLHPQTWRAAVVTPTMVATAT